jgi:hypothetical protein
VRCDRVYDVPAVPVPTAASVGGTSVLRPETYLRLLAGPAAGFPPVARWLTVSVRSETPSPWTDGQIDIKLSARGRIVTVESWPHRIPLRLARLARRSLPLAP